MDVLYGFFRSLWLLWLVFLFIGIVAWVWWPKRKAKLESHGQIPLRDDEIEG